MPKYEYKVKTVDGAGCTAQLRSELVKALNKAADEGYRVVAMVEGAGEGTERLVILEREAG